MKSRVSYKKAMRERAISERKGLYTIDLINASKTPGKFGSRTQMQGTAGAEEYAMVSRFLLKLIKFRAAKNTK